MDELVNYVTETPENTNPNVVRSLASQMAASGGSGIVVHALYDESGVTLDKTYKEIRDAVLNNGGVHIVGTTSNNDEGFVSLIIRYHSENNYSLYRIWAYDWDEGETITYTATSEDDYPRFDFPPGET